MLVVGREESFVFSREILGLEKFRFSDYYSLKVKPGRFGWWYIVFLIDFVKS